MHNIFKLKNITASIKTGINNGHHIVKCLNRHTAPKLMAKTIIIIMIDYSTGQKIAK